jgi:hypothetical protein
MLHFGILAGQDKTLEIGDIVTDPFNVLNVKDIYIDKEFTILLQHIDYNKLINSTANFSLLEWEQYMKYNYFLLYTPKDQEIIARFAWWLCYQILYVQKNNKYINISDILRDEYLNNQLRLYIYTSNVVEYTIAAALHDGPQIQIRFTDKTNLK